MRKVPVALATAATAAAVAGSYIAVGVLAGPPGHGHVHAPHEGKAVIGVTWAARPRTLAEVAARAAAVVTAEVVAVNAGPSLQPPPGTPDPDAAAIPTQRITFRTTTLHAGSLATTFTLFKTGTERTWLEGDPPYLPGERYLLYVEPRLGPDKQPDGTYLPVAPDGRLRVTAGSTVEPVIDGAVADEVRGRRLDEVVRTGGEAR